MTRNTSPCRNPMSLNYIAPQQSSQVPTTAALSPAFKTGHNQQPLPCLPAFSEMIHQLNRNFSRNERTLESRRQLPRPVNPLVHQDQRLSSPITTSFTAELINRELYGRLGATSPTRSLSGSTCYSGSSSCSSRRSLTPPVQSHRVSKSSQRSERYEYDGEEVFAMVYLRHKNVHWREIVETSWPWIFPNGRVRRPEAPIPLDKPVPPVYTERTGGGLQCRYYRARSSVGMKTVRHDRKTGGLSEEAGLRRLELELVQAWVSYMGPSQLRSIGLTRQSDEDNKSWLARALVAYRERSEFWQMLRSCPALHGVSAVLRGRHESS